jgi:hypothetical protein
MLFSKNSVSILIPFFPLLPNDLLFFFFFILNYDPSFSVLFQSLINSFDMERFKEVLVSVWSQLPVKWVNWLEVFHNRIAVLILSNNYFDYLEWTSIEINENWKCIIKNNKIIVYLYKCKMQKW